MVRAIVGANWGDEGKGKITDMFASQADMVIRFQGGANAGHTIINDYGKFALHLLPSGVCQPGTVNIIGNGVALDIEKLVKEIEHVTSAGVPQPNILVSERAQIMMPYHVMLDTYEEERLKDKNSARQRVVSLRSIRTSMRRSASRSVSCSMRNISEKSSKESAK